MTVVSNVRHRWRRRLVVCLIAAVLLSLLATAAVWRVAGDRSRGITGDVQVTASSTKMGFSAQDAVASGSPATPGAGWQSNGETTGAWIELSWSKARALRQVVIVRNPIGEAGVTSGFLSFGDGSFIQLTLSTNSRETVLPIMPRTVNRLRFTAVRTTAEAQSVTVAEIIVSDEPSEEDVVANDGPDGNASPNALATQSMSTAGSDPRAMHDGSGAPGAAGSGSNWSVNQPDGAWLQLTWARPRELAGVELVGSVEASAMLTEATLQFSDGTEMPIGEVLADPRRPTILSFMPRVTTSIRIVINRVEGSGRLVLGELRAYQRGATPVRPRAQTASKSAVPDGDDCDAGNERRDGVNLAVLCPQTGSVVDRSVTFRIATGGGYSSVAATVWPADESAHASAPVVAKPDPSGITVLTADVSRVPPGPLTVLIESRGLARPTRQAYFQLYRRGESSAVPISPNSPSAGRTLAYAEEFDAALSGSRSGASADYALAKPTHSGVEDFGDAIFGDPRAGFDNVKVIDNRYLRIDVEPIPAGYADPQGWGRSHISGLLASARQGGSGFSAQYGYFEARMLAPAVPGTWPAFWMLPSDNLIVPQSVSAEIDAIELYGHDPKGACHSTHQYRDGRSDGGIAKCGLRFSTDRTALSWHTYGVSVTPTDIIFYIDGRMVETVPQVLGGDSPLFFLVNLALGGGWPVKLQSVQDRAVLYVDYVRVYV